MEGPVVELQDGFIRGVVEKHEDGFDYYAFRGIPYAEPPVGDLRFEDPVPKKSWSGVLDCTKYGPVCLQHSCLFGIDTYDEDVLHLNVFTHSINREKENVPVMFVIHGGAFIIGSADDFCYGPEYFIRQNIVLVLVNYRLGVLGFLDLEDEVMTGNQGIKDQLLGLKWVQQNIRQFGGDPENVTVLGISAGGVAAHYLALSPAAKGLIHKAIVQGGSIYTPWAQVNNKKAKAIKLCSLLGKNLTDSAEILQFLKTVDTKSLQEAQEKLRILLVSSQTFPFGPNRDDKSRNPIMPMDPIAAANQGTHLPLMIGCNSDEGIFLLKGLTRRQFFEMCDLDFGSMLLYNMRDILNRYNLNEKQLRQLYYGDEAVSEDNLERWVNLSTDVFFKEVFHRLAKVQVEKSSAATYLFLFSYESPMQSMSKFLFRDAPREQNGCGHLDDLPYFFKIHAFEKVGIPYFEKGSKDYKLMERVTKMWANFATYGKPTVETSELIPVHWIPLRDGTVLDYLDIDEDITMKTVVNLEQKFLEAKNLV